MGFVVLTSSLCAALPFEMAIKNGTPMGFVSLMNFLCAALPFEMAIKSGRLWGSSICKLLLRPLFLLKWLSKAEGDGVRLSCKHPLPALPSPWRGVGGEALMLRLYSKLVFLLWFSLLFRIFHQT